MNFLLSRINRRLLWLGRRCCLVVAPLSRVVPVDVGYPIVGCRTVSFDFFMIVPFVDDDCFHVATNVDNIVQVAVGAVERVAKLLMVLCLENHLWVVVQVDSDYDSWWRWRNFVACCCFTHLWFGEEFIIEQVFQHCRISFSVCSVREKNHENFAIVAANSRIDIVFLERKALLER